MKAHNKDLGELSLAVATLRYDDAGRLAQGIASQGRIDPNSGPALGLPPAFFELQDALKSQATDVVAAAKERAPEPLWMAYDNMLGICMSCHQAFHPVAAAR